MLSSKSLIVCLVVLFVSYSSSASVAKNVLGKTLSQHYTIPDGGNILFNLLSSVNVTHAVFGTCSDNDSETICKIILTRLDSTDKTLSCNITIKNPKKYTRFEQNATVTLLLNDRALVSWKDSQKLTLINVNFYGCSTNKAEIEIDDDHESIYAVNVLAYENSYDIFFANSKLCQKSYCRMTFDNEGNIVKDIAAWGDEIFCDKLHSDRMRTVAHNSPVNGFIVENDVNVSFVNNEGHKLWTVKEYSTDFTVSTFGNYIGTCLSKWFFHKPDALNVLPTLECKKFDFEGNLVKTELQVNTSSLVGENKTIHYLTRLNLPEGFILFTVLCPDTYYPCAGGSCVIYHFDENGKMLKATEINDFTIKGDWLILVKAIQNDAGQMCVFVVDYDRSMKNIEISLRCFTDDEL